MMRSWKGKDVTRVKQSYHLATECFLLKRGSLLMAYFPKRGEVLAINREAWRFLARLKAAGADRKRLTAAEQAIVRQLDQMKLIARGGIPPPRKASVVTRPTAYAPTRVALLLTNRCNLRCRYCYSMAGSTPRAELSLEAALAAVDLIVENAKRAGESAALVLHGGGEPSCAWSLLKAVVEHFESRAREAQIKTLTAIATNGVIPLDRLAWLAEHVQDFCISLDGPPEIQDRQRPKAGGAGSYEDVARTFTYLDNHGKRYFVMATVTSESVGSLTGLVPLLAGRSGCCGVLLAPVYECGYGTKSVSQPKADDFIKACRLIDAAARPAGLSAWYIGARSHMLVDHWCDATAANTSFDVTPEGLVSCCYMVTEPSDPRAKLFLHGKYDVTSGQYVFDPAAQARLRSRSIETIPACRDCFCKYNCGGGCLNQAPGLYKVNRYRCRLNRTLTMDQLVDALRTGAAKTARVARKAGKPVVKIS